MVEGIGVDIVDIERISRSIRSSRFRLRVFTAGERAYCEGAREAERFAGRFAAKEAIFKALGRSFSWQEVEVLPGKQGRPEAHLSGKAAGVLNNRRILVSISHSSSYAVAQALIEAAPGQP